jgi:hypothetical protein
METIVKARAIPERRLPLVAGTTLVALSLPLFVLVGWSVRGWGFGALLWVAGLLLELLFARIGIAGEPSIRGSGVVALGMMSRGIVIMLVAFLVAATNPAVGVAGALLYAAAYTLEFGVFLALFFKAAAP